MQFVFDKPGKTVTFGGYSYSKPPISYSKINPENFIRGGSFDVDYASEYVDNDISHITITYYFDSSTSILKLIAAKWYEKGEGKKQKSMIFDQVGYVKSKLGSSTLDKRIVIPKLLNMVKNDNYDELTISVSGLEKMNLGWPELADFRKSINAHFQ